MIQSFQCISCGQQNAFGEPVCTQCGQPFIYNCPVCGSHINNRYARCHGCGTAFHWISSVQQNVQDKSLPTAVDKVPAHIPDQVGNKVPESYSSPLELSEPIVSAVKSDTVLKSPEFSYSKVSSPFSNLRLWILLIIICVALMGLILGADWFINKGGS